MHYVLEILKKYQHLTNQLIKLMILNIFVQLYIKRRLTELKMKIKILYSYNCDKKK